MTIALLTKIAIVVHGVFLRRSGSMVRSTITLDLDHKATLPFDIAIVVLSVTGPLDIAISIVVFGVTSFIVFVIYNCYKEIYLLN